MIKQIVNKTEDMSNAVMSPSGKIQMRYGDEVYSFSLKQWGYLLRLINDEGSLDKMSVIADEMGISDKEYAKWLSDNDIVHFINNALRDKLVKSVKGENWWLSRMIGIFEDETVSMKNRIEAGKEIGSRVAPKVDRIQHEFENVDFIFTAKRSE